MIHKKVERSKKSKRKSKAKNIRDLIDYILGLANLAPGEKVLYANGRGFITDSVQARREEMVALASEAVRSKMPVDHHIFSWREGEQPTAAQVEEQIDMLVDEFNVPRHQIIYALHQDTDNIHLHVAINRVDPETYKCVEINRGFDIEAGHRLIARVEHAQGWQREANGRYIVLENGELARSPTNPEQPREPDQARRDMENRTGEKSAVRIAIERGAEILRNAKSWQELHKRLEENGLRYERSGSGAAIFVGDIPVKASDVDRNASFSKMQKRLGIYEPPEQEHSNVYINHTPKPYPGRSRQLSENSLCDLSKRRLAHHGSSKIEGVLSVDARAYRRQSERLRRELGAGKQLAPEPIKANVPGWDDYIAGRKAHYAEKSAEKLENDKRQAAERKALSERQKSKRDKIFSGSWKGRGELLNALRSTLAAEQAAEKLALKEKHQHERLQHRQRFRPFPDFEQWQRLQGRQDLADAWRYKASEPQRINGEHDEVPTLRDIRAYQGQVVGRQVVYTRVDAEGGAGGGVSFVDHGKGIDIHDWRTRDTTLAALQLAAQKWGGFILNGDDEYKMMCVRLAAEHGFKIKNPELQDLLQQERQRIKAERAEARKSEQLKQFERYAAAVGAERYRVTSIKMLPGGKKLTFILDKKDGITKGFTPAEVAQRTREMQRLQRRGENLYYTPLSDDKHHILIDDMDREKLGRLIKDGYRPAAALESSPGNYQAIITIPKLGTAHDRDVSNRLAELLNRQYGDPKLSGAIHPHRAPGYENRKQQHQREDGSFPEVRLVAAERRDCAVALALSDQINKQHGQESAMKAEQRQAQAPSAAVSEVVSDAAIDAYQHHCRDILRRQRGGAVDLSRVDSMIAVRLRVTGHDLGEIEDAIRLCAPGLRTQGENRDWNDYAQRTARYAFGPAGDRQVSSLVKYREQWIKLEERARTIEADRDENNGYPDI